jgi:predicted N-acetyltransferase YhbS
MSVSSTSCGSCSTGPPGSDRLRAGRAQRRLTSCERRDSNPHARRHRLLRPARLPFRHSRVRTSFQAVLPGPVLWSNPSDKGGGLGETRTVSRPELRPMTEADIPAAVDVAAAAFDDLDERLTGRAAGPWAPARMQSFIARLRSFLLSDGPGCWVAEGATGLDGVATASMREGVWGLALLVVRPGRQAAGLGGALLAEVLAYGAESHTGIICASDDSRALRRYAAAGFRLHPAYEASGVPTAPLLDSDPWVEQVDPTPHVAQSVDRQVRGGARGPDYALLAAEGMQWFRIDGSPTGYAVASDDRVFCVAAESEAAAAALLRRILADAARDGRAMTIDWITGGQQWALDVVLETKLSLRNSGSVCWRGRPEPTAYLPNGGLL